MKRFVEGADRSQSTLFPERLDNYVGEDNPVRVVDVFVDEPETLSYPMPLVCSIGADVRQSDNAFHLFGDDVFDIMTAFGSW